MKLKLFEMFAGYGGASFALKKAGIEFETVGFSEKDKFAVQCYNQNHVNHKKTYTLQSGTPVWVEKRVSIKNFGDATKINVDDLPDFDLLTGGFPCQAFSNAGKGLGELDTRGTLFREIIRIAEAKMPKYMLLENVKGLTTKKHKATFDKILSELKRIGYVVSWKIVNSKKHGIPQNRERVFFMCYRMIDTMPEERNMSFPEKEELKIFLKDILEDEVDEKYYLSEKALSNVKYHRGNKVKGECDIISGCLTSSMHKGYGNDGCTVVRIKNATKKGYSEAYQGDGLSLEHPNSKTRRGRVQNQMSPTLQCNDSKGVITEDMRIRKLTPTECFRLMGFLNDEINLDGLSNTQRYKLAGNGWDINIVSKIFNEMLKRSSGQR